MPTSIPFVAVHGAESPAIPTRRFSVAEYHRMAELGLLTEQDRVELLEGVISPKMVHSPIHDATVSVVEQVLRHALVPEWFLRVQSAITLPASEPEPDIAVVMGPPARYAAGHPNGPDVALAVEVAESSLARDRAKVMTYARGGIACYWIVNIQARCLEVYDAVENEVYTRQRVFSVKKTVEGGPAFRANTWFPVESLLIA